MLGAASLGWLAATGALSAVTAESLNQALSATYQYNPQIDAQRARLRATDEQVAIAMSGYRPKINANGDINWQHQTNRPFSIADGVTRPAGYSVDLVQPIFTGLQTTNAVRAAEATVRAGRQTLRDTERTVFLQAVTAYMDVVRDQAIVKLQENNVQVLSRELKATQDRFAVGEVTKTDVAQAEARRAGAVSQLDLARANLKTSRASYEQVVGHPVSNVAEPALPARLLPRNLDDAVGTSARENPLVVAALYNEEAGRYQVDQIRGALLPQLQFEANWTDRFEPGKFTDETKTATVTGRMTVPIYEGGQVYAQVRQAKHHLELAADDRVDAGAGPAGGDGCVVANAGGARSGPIRSGAGRSQPNRAHRRARRRARRPAHAARRVERRAGVAELSGQSADRQAQSRCSRLLAVVADRPPRRVDAECRLGHL